MSVRVFAPAKVNLTLQVGRPRADGLHPLQSVAAFADVGDRIEAAPADELTLEITGPFASTLAAGPDNLVLRAARALAESCAISRGAALRLEKNLPVASGLGGGSSDAAATLKALNALWRLGLEERDLIEIARGLGADAPVCVAARAAYMTGAGETFAPIALPRLAAVLVNPGRPLATAEVYRQFDRMNLGAGFTEAQAPDWPSPAEAAAGIARIGNDLAPAAHALMPELDEIAARLGDDGRVRRCGLSGSGATFFALTETAGEARALCEELARERPSWWVRSCRLAGDA